MNDWQDEWWKQVEKTAAEMEEFFAEVGKATESLVDEVGENLDSFLEQLPINLVQEVDTFIQEFVEVIVSTTDEIDAALSNDWDDFIDDDFTRVDYHTPSTQSNPACVDCVNYHGHAYNGNLLVCAMHPSGYQGNDCPDWSKT
ncbi:MAG: hypothetical protein AAFO95_22185 [Cyanobacteria bacterium J06600_6]